MSDNVHTLAVAEPAFKEAMLECLDHVRQNIVENKVTGFMVNAVETDNYLAHYSAGNLKGTEKIGILMGHVFTILKAMNES